jgi:hypothetical protein
VSVSGTITRTHEDSVTVPFSGVSWTIVFPHITTIFLCPAALIPENPNAPLGALWPMVFALIHGSSNVTGAAR